MRAGARRGLPTFLLHIRCDRKTMHLHSLRGFCSSNAAHGGRRKTKEEIMNFNLTRNDLATKTTSQLAALFQDATIAIVAYQDAIASAQSLRVMIQQEIAKRGPAP
jgi:hypothetical protein